MVNRAKLDFEKEMNPSFEQMFRIIWVVVILYLIVWPTTNNGPLMRMMWIPSMLLVHFFSIPALSSRRLIIEILAPIIIAFLSILSSNNARDIEHLFAIFSYINMFMLISICGKTIPTKRTFDFIFYSNVILSLLFSLYSLTPIAYRVRSSGAVWSSVYFVFGLENSNFAGMVLFSFFCILIINLSYRRFKFPILILAAYIFYMMYKTNCRSVIISAVFVVISYVFIRKIKIPKIVIIAACIVPMLFISVYLTLFHRYGGDEIVFLGKSLFSGRQRVFNDFLSYLSDWWHIIFGNYSSAGLQNAHNIVLAVFASLGIVGVIGFYSFYLRVLNGLQRADASPICTMCIICILAFFVQSSMEASYFLGGFPGIMFLSTFVLIANYTGDEITE